MVTARIELRGSEGGGDIVSNDPDLSKRARSVIRHRRPNPAPSVIYLGFQPCRPGSGWSAGSPRSRPWPSSTWAWSPTFSSPSPLRFGSLRHGLDGKDFLAGKWSVRELVERLEQVGVQVQVERTA